MPTRPPQHRPQGWKPVPRVRTDAIDRHYGTAAWRRTAAACIKRAGGQCHYCGKLGADTAHHLTERREGGSDRPENLAAVHRACHNRMHGKRGA